MRNARVTRLAREEVDVAEPFMDADHIAEVGAISKAGRHPHGVRELTDTMAETTRIKHASSTNIPALRDIEH